MAAGSEPDVGGNLTVTDSYVDYVLVCVPVSDRHRDYGGYFSPVGGPPGHCELPYPPQIPVQVQPSPGPSPMVTECDDSSF